MKALLSTTCIKQYKKLPQDIQKKFDERVDLFLRDPRNPQLNIHKLRGDKKQFTSMNVTGNYRALFVRADKQTTRGAKYYSHHSYFLG